MFRPDAQPLSGCATGRLDAQLDVPLRNLLGVCARVRGVRKHKQMY